MGSVSENKIQDNLASYRLFNLEIVDIAFGGFLVCLSAFYFVWIYTMQLPSWDGASFLTNAHAWLHGSPLSESFRPPLLSWIISAIWSVTGENWEIVKYLPGAF